eukprot:GFUD01042289.1.p1 GENE.GFUD01042289.1~~GFUD01042289.1.p1  ORF type:complete len:969 (-),score=187.65 GFUD01042289.1:50-2956(-)
MSTPIKQPVTEASRNALRSEVSTGSQLSYPNNQTVESTPVVPPDIEGVPPHINRQLSERNAGSTPVDQPTSTDCDVAEGVSLDESRDTEISPAGAVQQDDNLNSRMEFKIKQLVDEIMKNNEGKRKGMEKKCVNVTNNEEIKRSLKKLSFNEKCNRNSQLFKEHIKEETLSNFTIYSCQSCSSFVATVNRLSAERHSKSHSAPKKRARDRIFTFECALCDLKLPNKKAHVQHFQELHCQSGLKQISCTKCFKCFDNTTALKLHIKTVHLDLKRFECLKCGKKVRDQFNLNLHEQSHCNLCSLCGNTFLTKKLLNRHIRCAHEDLKKVICHVCGKVFRDNYGLERHQTDKHKLVDTGELIGVKEKKASNENKENEPPSNEEIGKKNRCPLCKKNVQKLNWHLKMTHGVDKNLNPMFNHFKYHCKTCDKPMRDFSNLSRHEKSCRKSPERDFQCDVCLKIFFSKRNMMNHKKEIHQTPKTCEKCAVTFADKQKFYDHLPCQYSCNCGNNFSSFYRFSLHSKICDHSQTERSEVSKAQYHNVISYECFVCGLDGIQSENVRRHVEESHDHLKVGYSIECESCHLDVASISEHIFDKHASVRRLKKSYVKFNGYQTQMLCPTVLAVKSRPVNNDPDEVEFDVIKSGVGPSAEYQEEGLEIKRLSIQPCETEPDHPPVETSPARNSQQDLTQPTIGLSAQIGEPKDFSSLLHSQPGAAPSSSPSNNLFLLNLPSSSAGGAEEILPHPAYQGGIDSLGMRLVQSETTLSQGKASNPNESENCCLVNDKDLDLCLMFESEEQRKKNMELDLLDQIIKERIESGRREDEIMGARLDRLKNKIKNQEEAANINKDRAATLSKIGLAEIKGLAQSSLSHIEKIEDEEIITPRKKLYKGCAGEQQSLFYKRIWQPFTDDQHEVVLDVLSDWHKKRGTVDERYMMNVTLPELFLCVYQQIFGLDSVNEAEVAIANTPISD